MLYCTLTDADGGELWHGSLQEFAIDNCEAYERLRADLLCGPLHMGGGASPLTVLRLDTVRLTRDDTTITELDAAIMARLADKMAGTRPAWFEPAANSRDAQRFYRREHLSMDLLSRYFGQSEGYSRAHADDVVHVQTLARLLAADWLPARAVEYLGE